MLLKTFMTIGFVKKRMADEHDMRSTKRSRRARGPGLTAKGDERKFVEHNYADHGNENELSDGCEDEYDHEILQRYRQYASNIHKEGLSGKNKCGPFPFRFHMILSEIEKDGDAHIVSWLTHGRSFAIHKQGLFQAEIMPKYFKQSKITSFHRQLNLYGYQRLTHGKDCGSYYHEFFLRGKPFLTRKMVRTKVKGTKIRAASSPDDEPNFYHFPPVGATLPAYVAQSSNFAAMPGGASINDSLKFMGRGSSNTTRSSSSVGAGAIPTSSFSSLSSQIAAQGLIGLSDLQHPPFHHYMHPSDVSNTLLHRQLQSIETLSALTHARRLEAAASSSFGGSRSYQNFEPNGGLLLNSYLDTAATSNLSAADAQHQQALLLSMAHQTNNPSYYLPSDHTGLGGGRLQNLADPPFVNQGRQSMLPTSTDPMLSGGSVIPSQHLRMLNNSTASLPLGTNLPTAGTTSSLSSLLDERYLEALRSNGDFPLSTAPRITDFTRRVIAQNGRGQAELMHQHSGSSNNGGSGNSIFPQDRRIDLLMQQQRRMPTSRTFNITEDRNTNLRLSAQMEKDSEERRGK